MAIEVRTLESKDDFTQFRKLPYRVYRGQQTTYRAWVPPLNIDVKNIFNSRHNALYKHAKLQGFLAWKNDTTVGRIIAIVDRDFCEYQKTETGFVGYFESMDDSEVAKVLFSRAEDWLRQQGMKRVIGPVNGSTNGQMGNQIDSFDILPVIEMPYSPRYYGTLYETSGYHKAQDLYSYQMDTRLDLSEKIVRVAELTRKRNKVEVRTVKMKDWEPSLDIVRRIWDDAWADNWGYVPWNKFEFSQLADTLKMIVDPDVTLFAYIGDNPVAFVFPIPDLNEVFHALNGKLLPLGIFKLLRGKTRAERIRIAAFGVCKTYQNKGIDALLIYELYKRGVKKGYSAAEFSWILENNLELRNLLENWGAEHYRTHRVYEKEL